MTAAEDRLRELYAQEPPVHRSIAVAEREVWSEYRASTNGPVGRRQDFFASRFGLKKPTHAMFRASLLGHEEWCGPLWSLVLKVGLRKTYAICLDLSKRPDRAQQAEMYGTDPSLAEQFKCPQSTANTKSVQASPSDVREMRSKMRDLVRPFAEQRISDFDDPAVTEDIVSAFEIEVEAAFNDFLSRVDRVRRRNGSQAVIQTRRRDLKRACEMLGLKLPPRGGSIDMDAARRQHRKLSAQFHPDITGENEQMTGQYLEVQRAWEIISEYQA